jgi:hypothetical protein
MAGKKNNLDSKEMAVACRSTFQFPLFISFPQFFGGAI